MEEDSVGAGAGVGVGGPGGGEETWLGSRGRMGAEGSGGVRRGEEGEERRSLEER
jgi:hypothetical protein